MKKLYIDNAETYVIVDNEDYDSANEHNWHMNMNQGTFRILGWINGKKISLQYYLTGKMNLNTVIANLKEMRPVNIRA